MAKSGKNLDDLQDINRALMINLLREKGSCSRADLAKASGLKQASITKIIRDLMEAGIVLETGFTEGAKGRRSIGLTLNCAQYKVVAVKLSRRTITSCVYDISGKKYSVGATAQEIAMDPYYTLDSIVAHIKARLEEHPEALAIGVALPGFYLRKKDQMALIMDYTTSWHEVSIRREIQKHFTIPVFVEHDANAGALAHWSYGKDRTPERKVLLHLVASEGIGAGVIVDGKVFSGSQGIAGEAGHLSIDYDGRPCECGSRGCMQQYCSSVAFERRVKELLPQHPHSLLSQFSEVSVQDVFFAMRQKDTFACEMVREVGRYIGYGLMALVFLFNPDVIVISDLMSEGGELMLDSARQVLRERLLPVLYDDLELKYSEVEDDLILLGAGAVAVSKILSHPSEYLVKG